MADGQFPTLVSKDQNVNAATNPLFAALTDGTNAATFTGTSLNVNITGGSSSATEYAEDSAAVDGDLGTQALAVRQDTLAASTDADGDYTPLKVNAAGALYVSIVNASIVVTATNLDIRDLTHVSDSVRIGDGTDLANVTGAGELNVLSTAQPGVDIGDVTVNNAAGAAAVNIQDGGNSITVDATDLDIRNLNLTDDAVKVSGNASANSVTNPIFVAIAPVVSSTEVNSYNTAAAVAAGASSNHDYTVTGTTFLLKRVLVACSGAEKIEVQVGPVASLVSKAVAFIPNAGGYQEIVFDPAIEVPATSTGTVRVIRTNRNNQATDVYSTILGNDLP